VRFYIDRQLLFSFPSNTMEKSGATISTESNNAINVVYLSCSVPEKSSKGLATSEQRHHRIPKKVSNRHGGRSKWRRKRVPEGQSSSTRLLLSTDNTTRPFLSSTLATYPPFIRRSTTAHRKVDAGLCL